MRVTIVSGDLGRSPRMFYHALAVLIAAAAGIFRAWGPFHKVFRDGFVNFQGDAWYHLRAIDHLVHNFPHRLTFDPYAGLTGAWVPIAPFFDYLVTSIAYVAASGAPSTIVIERVAAVMPALLGAVATLLVYWLGSRVFGTRAGLLAAAIVAVMPGPFLDRTVLGAADHHALEAVLVLTTMSFGVIGYDAASRRALFRVAAGVSLGAYFLTWTGAPILALALALWLLLQFSLNFTRGRSTQSVAAMVATMAAIALVMMLAFQTPSLFRYGLQVQTLSALFALSIAILAAERWHIRGHILIAALALTAAAVASAVALGVVRLPVGLIQDIARFRQGALGRTIAEMRPLLSQGDRWSLSEPWHVFRTSFYIGVPALLVLGVRLVRRPDPGAALLAVWGVVSLAATVGQVRFGYYLAPVLAILTGWACSSFLAWIEARRRSPWQVEVATVLIAAIVFYPSMRLSLAALEADNGVPLGWERALKWMQQHTPEPFGDPAVYFRRYDPSAMPVASYAVMNWWDYGYWITRVARRVPVSNPTQFGAVDAARFFTATVEREAVSILAERQARYVIVDRELAFSSTENPLTLRGKFAALVKWSGRRESDFFEQMLSRGPDGRLTPVFVFYPDYYRAMAIRLSRFDASGVESDGGAWVITYDDRAAAEGGVSKEILEKKRFASQADADAYLAILGPGPYRLVSFDPTNTCVSLPALAQVRLVHEEKAADADVRVFEGPAPIVR